MIIEQKEIHYCDHGCGQIAKFYSEQHKTWRCSKSVSCCPKMIENNIKKHKDKHPTEETRQKLSLAKRKSHIFKNGLEYKKCGHCKEIKLLNEFNKNKNKWDGLNNRCNKCNNEYYDMNINYFKEKNRQEYLKNKNNENYKKDRREYLKSWSKINMDKIKIYKKISNKNRKIKRNNIKRLIFEHYGTICTICGETEPKFLTIDHINNDGAEHRKNIKKSYIYDWLYKNNFPEGFQTLCFNCNRKKWMLSKPKNYNKHIKHNKKIKTLIFNHYGKKCVCCGENDIDILVIDHINGDGYKNSKIIKKSFYTWIIKNNFPANLQTLCYNCNWGKEHNNNICPHKEQNKENNIFDETIVNMEALV